jgi:hypothetical protein
MRARRIAADAVGRQSLADVSAAGDSYEHFGFCRSWEGFDGGGLVGCADLNQFDARIRLARDVVGCRLDDLALFGLETKPVKHGTGKVAQFIRFEIAEPQGLDDVGVGLNPAGIEVELNGKADGSVDRRWPARCTVR